MSSDGGLAVPGASTLGLVVRAPNSMAHEQATEWGSTNGSSIAAECIAARLEAIAALRQAVADCEASTVPDRPDTDDLIPSHPDDLLPFVRVTDRRSGGLS